MKKVLQGALGPAGNGDSEGSPVDQSKRHVTKFVTEGNLITRLFVTWPVTYFFNIIFEVKNMAIIVSGAELAEFLDISRMHVNRFANENVLNRQNKKYDVEESVDRLIIHYNKKASLTQKESEKLEFIEEKAVELRKTGYKTPGKKRTNKKLEKNNDSQTELCALIDAKDEEKSKEEDSSTREAKRQTAWAELRLKKIELEKKEGELISAVEAEKQLVKAVVAFKSKLRSIGSKLAPVMYGMTRESEIKNELDKAHDDVLREFKGFRFEQNE